MLFCYSLSAPLLHISIFKFWHKSTQCALLNSPLSMKNLFEEPKPPLIHIEISLYQYFLMAFYLL